MARPSVRKPLSSTERKELTLKRVTAVFAKKGFNGATTADLATASGVSQALLYKLFGDKRGLYEAMIQRKIIEVQGGALRIAYPKDGDDRRFFTELAAEILKRTRQDPDFVRLLLYSNLEGSPFAQLFYAAHGAKAVGHVVGYLRQRAGEGAFRDVDPETAAFSFLASVWQYGLSRYVFAPHERPPADTGDMIRTLVDVFLLGVRSTRSDNGV